MVSQARQAGVFDQHTKLEQLVVEERWQEIIALAPHLAPSPDVAFAYGVALARLGRFREAEAALQDGHRLSPHDTRFLVELAGVAFKQGNYPIARAWIERAQRIVPRDDYIVDFLATVLYLEGNLEAALALWNRIDKPHIESIVLDPRPQINPILLDRALAFSPATTLRLGDLWTSEARIDQLGVFSALRYDLRARSQGNFVLQLVNRERHGCAERSWQCLLVIFGETPGQTLNFHYYNLGRGAINIRSSFRWDEEKRRIRGQLDLPLAHTPQWHLRLGTDLRNENWAIRNSFSGPSPLLAALNLKREAALAEFDDVLSWRWKWSTTTEIAHSSYHNVLPGNLLTSTLLSSGVQLKQTVSLGSELLRAPERHFNIASAASFAVARLWSNPGRDFAQLTTLLNFHWLSSAAEKYEVEHVLKVGRTFGDPPFSELFTLGVLGDTDLRLKAHIATRDGKKGSSPFGRNYLVSNWDATRNFRPWSLAQVKVGPFVDTGKVSDPLTSLPQHRWLWDVGLEAKVNAFGFGLVLSYGRDLRAGHGALVLASQ
ncbi:MAG: tetratricopeptide repeat protein [Acidobacteria bacterium]|nr:tetratricopeptide repeat protein [Acidobacteriota bacterium]